MRVLILCTGNSARSLIAEALLNALGEGRVEAVSAGSAPRGEPHPIALETLKRHGHDASGLRSKSWDEFAGPGAPALDAVITVCGSAAGEACPVWPGAPARAHWGEPDPAAIDNAEQARIAFEDTYQALKTRIEAFLEALDGTGAGALEAALKAGADARPQG